MSRAAVIDVGTNSVRLLIADFGEIGLKIQLKEILTTRLGKGVDRDRRLSSQAINNTLDAIRKFRDRAISLGAGNVLVIATSAVRDAVNGETFMQEVKKLAVRTKILTGNEEAELGFLGACLGIGNIEGKVLLIDIGGGSTELVLGSGNAIHYMTSLDIGAVRLTEKFGNSNTASRCQLDSISDFVKKQLSGMEFPNNQEIARMVGIGGTITSLAAIDQKLEIYDRNAVHGYVLQKEQIDRILELMLCLTLEERQKIPGLQRERADIIVAGIIILKCVMEYFAQHEIHVSEWDNLEGAVYKWWS
ncbi:MAG: Ppx/GppA phosphatase family protein [Bacillota bacterium]|nr:Ppx/GppA phosphatase family protein [Bacillota bacterium]